MPLRLRRQRRQQNLTEGSEGGCSSHPEHRRTSVEQRPRETQDGALRALGDPGDEPNEHERVAAASLAAVGLGLLRTDVERISRLDEYTMRYLHTGAASAEQIALLTADLPDYLSGTTGILAASHAIEETLHPLIGAERAVSLVIEERRG